MLPSEILKTLNLPDLLSADEMTDMLLREEYGYLPPKPQKVEWVSEKFIRGFCAGKASSDKVTLTFTVNGKEFSFPIHAAIPTKEGKHPFFIHVNFRDSIPDRHLPVEEIIDNGYAVLSFCYEDITKDNDDFTDGLAGVLYEDGKRGPHDGGKISMWAWAAQRVMDYAETLTDILDTDRAVICGHSRLGKTALLAAATDKRFKFCYSNDSGCCGSAISRGKQGETLEDIFRVFPHWFCENFLKYAENPDKMPFDQHFLIASIAPRPVCVGSAENDLWADPLFEMLGCIAASPAFEKSGVPGLVCNDRTPHAADVFFDGTIGYHMRAGNHYFSREDWNRAIEFVNLHSQKQ